MECLEGNNIWDNQLFYFKNIFTYLMSLLNLNSFFGFAIIYHLYFQKCSLAGTWELAGPVRFESEIQQLSYVYNNITKIWKTILMPRQVLLRWETRNVPSLKLKEFSTKKLNYLLFSRFYTLQNQEFLKYAEENKG